MADQSIQRFRRVMAVALAHLEGRREEINDLNVFPVADGDTGDNMALTMRAVLEELERLEAESEDGDPKRPEIVRTVARAAMMGARGNSGVILSQIVRGAAEELASPPGRLIDPRLIAAALANAERAAYASIRNPVEGTMLTVAREMAAAVSKKLAHWEQHELSPEASDAEQNALLGAMLGAALEAAGDAVSHTPEQLDVLADAGVVDAGALGLAVMDAVRQRLVEPLLLERDADGEQHRPGRDQRPAVRGRSQQLEQVVAAGHPPRHLNGAGPARSAPQLDRPFAHADLPGRLRICRGSALDRAVGEPEARSMQRAGDAAVGQLALVERPAAVHAAVRQRVDLAAVTRDAARRRRRPRRGATRPRAGPIRAARASSPPARPRTPSGRRRRRARRRGARRGSRSPPARRRPPARAACRRRATPLRRAASDAPNSAVAPAFAAAWTMPARRTSSLAGSASAHSVRPVADAGSANAIPSAIRRSAASRDASPPSQSSSTALVQVPIGRSVSSGCSAWPSHVPLRASFTGPAGTAPRTRFPSARRRRVELLDGGDRVDCLRGRRSWSWRGNTLRRP